MEKSNNKNGENLFALIIGVFALFALKSIFQNDESKIISNQGKKYLSDDDKMKEINQKINSAEVGNQHNEIVV